MPKKIFSFVYALNYISQVAFMMLVPAALIIGGGWLLTNRCGLGKWVLVVSIVLGIVCGMYSMITFLLRSAACVDPTESAQKGDTDHEQRT